MALLDVEGVPVYLGEITAENLMASWQSIQDILVRHYSRQILHELYKVNGILECILQTYQYLEVLNVLYVGPTDHERGMITNLKFYECNPI